MTRFSDEIVKDGDEGFEQYSTEITNTGLDVNEKTNDISDNALNENITVDDFKNLLATRILKGNRKRELNKGKKIKSNWKIC